MTSPHTSPNPGRRAFLQTGAGLTLALCFAPADAAVSAIQKADAAESHEVNAFLRIGADNRVVVIAKHLEMGQGSHTGLATLLAEELDAAWSQVSVEGAPADHKRYGNRLIGGGMATGGSTAMADSFEIMRRAGASARAMLVAAAARRWGVAADTITVAEGLLHHGASGRQASFGELAEAASREPVPEQVKLKAPEAFRLIGKPLPRKDTAAKIRGTATFTLDVRLPGMLTALVAHPPRFGAKVRGFDARAAKAIPGVRHVVRIPNGVAVVAKDFWSAKKGRDALQVDWDESTAFRQSSDELLSQFKALAQTPGRQARLTGGPEPILASAPNKLSAEYEFPYLAHAAMEPLDCVVQLTANGCEIWNGEQVQTMDQVRLMQMLDRDKGVAPWDPMDPRNAAKMRDLDFQRVKLNMLFAGGSFGRRANPEADYLSEALEIALAVGGSAPLKLVWTREDDMRAGFYRPMFYHRMEGSLDATGKPEAWAHRLVGQALFNSGGRADFVDPASVEGASNLPYAIPHVRVDLHSPRLPVPVQWWRSVGATHTAFATECFLDELAHAGKQDPLALRRTLLKDKPRHLATLELAAQKAGWDQPLPPGKPGTRRGRGLAVHESFHTCVAQVAEVTVAADGSFKVDRVVCAVDCGLAINPDIVRAQMEGGIGFGLSAAFHGAITFKEGRVEQDNFDGYPLLRIHEMPAVDVHIVPSAAAPTGVGEPGTPVIAPAVANALFAATGQRLRKLPFDTTRLKAAAL